MEKRLIVSLLNIYHGDKPRVAASAALAQFVQDYNIGQRVGAALAFSEADRQAIGQLLLSEAGIDAAATHADQWSGLSRAASLAHADNEKMTDAAVRQHRVAVKALPHHCLRLDGQRIALPLGANLDLDWRWLAARCEHASVLLVENWEAFEAVHQVTFDLSRAGANPLVLFRGSPVYRQDYATALLERLAVPVFALVDYDPAGLVIAQSLPHFAGLMAPPLQQLVRALGSCTNHARYRSQLAQAQAVLDKAVHPDIAAHWQLLQAHGKALPQEYFLMPRVRAQEDGPQARAGDSGAVPVSA
jgi:hypothetical protein